MKNSLFYRVARRCRGNTCQSLINAEVVRRSSDCGNGRTPLGDVGMLAWQKIRKIRETKHTGRDVSAHFSDKSSHHCPDSGAT